MTTRRVTGTVAVLSLLAAPALMAGCDQAGSVDAGTADAQATDAGSADALCGALTEADLERLRATPGFSRWVRGAPWCLWYFDDASIPGICPAGLERQYVTLDATGRTCSRLLSSPVDLESVECADVVAQHHEACCNPACTPRPSGYVPPLPAVEEGPYPPNNLCVHGGFPGEPFTILTIATVSGNPSCSVLYWMFRSGNVDPRLQYPIQNFAQEPCGCGGPPAGAHPVCHVCETGVIPNTTVAPAGLTQSCADLYERGRNGELSPEECALVQPLTSAGCGCAGWPPPPVL